jgi:hypothetical protein
VFSDFPKVTEEDVRAVLNKLRQACTQKGAAPEDWIVANNGPRDAAGVVMALLLKGKLPGSSKNNTRRLRQAVDAELREDPNGRPNGLEIEILMLCSMGLSFPRAMWMAFLIHQSIESATLPPGTFPFTSDTGFYAAEPKSFLDEKARAVARTFMRARFIELERAADTWCREKRLQSGPSKALLNYYCDGFISESRLSSQADSTEAFQAPSNSPEEMHEAFEAWFASLGASDPDLGGF